jgi:opacity protein-like surface antigen
MMNKTKLVLGIATAALTVAGALVSQQAVAGTKAQHHATEAALVSKVDVLEAQLRAMQDEVSSIRAAAGNGADSAKVQELDAWMQEHKAKPEKVVHDNMIFFRGGYARNDSQRDDLLTGNQFGGAALGGVLGGGIAKHDAWYVGAGFDFGLTDDVWGLMADTEVDAELMFEYKNFGSKSFKNNPAIVGTGAGPGVNPNPQNGPLCTLINFASNDEVNGLHGAGGKACNSVTITQLTISAAPKFKFMKGSKFRPWLIPFGLALHVVSPPSNGVTVLNPGVMFAGGAEYAIWKEIKLGADVRYHYTGNDVDGVNTNGLTAGGYMGIGF